MLRGSPYYQLSIGLPLPPEPSKNPQRGLRAVLRLACLSLERLMSVFEARCWINPMLPVFGLYGVAGDEVFVDHQANFWCKFEEFEMLW